MSRQLREHYGDPKLRYNRYPVRDERYCGGRVCGMEDMTPHAIYDTDLAHIPRAINPASPHAHQYPDCAAGPHTGCVNHKNVCLRNGVPYDSKANLIIAPYSMPYETRFDCKRPCCTRGKLTCTKTARGMMYMPH